jgi:hypothetical protein
LVSCSSGGADGFRASEVEHAVEDADGNPGFDLLRWPTMRAQGVSNDALVSAHRPLGSSPCIVARGSLPAHPALLGNDLEMAVALGWIGFGRWTELDFAHFGQKTNKINDFTGNVKLLILKEELEKCAKSSLVSVRKKIESLESLMIPLSCGKGGGGCVDRG